MLLFVYLEILGLQRDLLRIAAHGVSNRAYPVDRRRVVAELVWARLREELAASAGTRDRVVSRAGFRQRREDLFESRAADPAFARRRENERSAPILHDLALPELLAERVEVDPLVDHPALLEVAHPAEGLFHVAAGLEDELQEELDQLLIGQEAAKEIDRVVGVAVAHGSSCQLSVVSYRFH